MAFEDRCSPNQANSPGPVPNGIPSSNLENPTSPNPNERNLKPYTCTTMTKIERTKSPSSRISPIISYIKPQPVSPVETSTINPVNPNIVPLVFNPYYNPYLMNTLPIHPDYLRLYQQNQMLPPVEMKPMFVGQEQNQRSHQNEENRRITDDRRRQDVTDEQADLLFSISNILKPEFGLNAIRKTTYKKEGPKSGGPLHSILYKPYDLAKGITDTKNVLEKTGSDYSVTSRNCFESKTLERRNLEYTPNGIPTVQESSLKPAPLGSLCNTVSQIGNSKHFPSKPFGTTSNGFRSDSKSSLGFGIREDYSAIRRPDSANSSISTSSSTVSSQQGATNGSDDTQANKSEGGANPQWPAWVYCTRYSDRPSSGPRSRKSRKHKKPVAAQTPEDKRPRTAFSSAQLARLKHEFAENRYLTERRRQQLSGELGLNEAQIKIWFQNKRAKIKKASGQKNPLALQLMAQGLYNHGTASCSEGEEDDDISVA